jgi:hypothetical protein
VRPRWERLALAQRRGEPIPPIQVYRVGDLHFVEDGHHRVSIAMAAHQEMIDAYVTEVLTNAPAPRRGARGPSQRPIPARAATSSIDMPPRPLPAGHARIQPPCPVPGGWMEHDRIRDSSAISGPAVAARCS